MIDNYNEVMNQWGGCGTMVVEPDTDLRRWAVQQTVTILANADYYYTKTEVDKLLEDVTHGGVTREEVQQMIDQAIAIKANQADLEALSAQVASNTAAILNTYTKQETNSLLESYLSKMKAMEMRDNYSKVVNTTLILNNELGITI
jgi:DNA-binding transcriptional regulator YhcF (GntR family)